MRKNLIFVIMVILVGAICFSSEALGQNINKVLLIPREGSSSDLDLMIKMEVGVMTDLLKKEGFEVDIATASGSPIIGPTQKIEKVLRLSEVKPDTYAGVIMACMAVGMLPGPPVSPDAVAMVKKVIADGKPVAASANSSIILAEAGVLKGKKYAYATDPLSPGIPWLGTPPDSRFEGAIYSGTGVVQDGKIITSAICPQLNRYTGMRDGTTELTTKFIAAIRAK
jgi:putative intracellular protease/amidase